MPKKNVFTKNDIAAAAYALACEKGIEALSARSVAERVGCSVCPVFSAFTSMEELRAEVVQRAREEYLNYVERGLKSAIAFKGVGLEYIKFAKQKPNLFKLLFMSQTGGLTVDEALELVEFRCKEVLASITDSYNYSIEQAKWLYRHMWVYTHGIAVMCVTKTYNFEEDDFSEMLTDVCVALMNKLENKND